MTESGTLSRGDWLAVSAQVAVVATCVVYLVTNEFLALIAWELVATLYLACGLIVAWRGSPVPRADRDEARAVVRWMWLPPLLAGLVGANAAVAALVAKGPSADPVDTRLLVLSCLGIIVSWALLQVGFAEIYEVLDAGDTAAGIRLPDERTPTTLDYLYFSFTVGTSFATSDAEVVGLRVRRVVLLHSVIAFFYNAVVVAVAFQVLQSLVAA